MFYLIESITKIINNGEELTIMNEPKYINCDLVEVKDGLVVFYDYIPHSNNKRIKKIVKNFETISFDALSEKEIEHEEARIKSCEEIENFYNLNSEELKKYKKETKDV